ncbi:MAG: PaaI family thioesterase [Proteobacteria bacterium]|nr:PaaI family thioesterase [Pseudomonadota bacterium]MBU1612009.1 PaaI family thioesterase [Pseudomonadota bacterium]
MNYLQALALPGQTVNPLFQMLGIQIESITAERAILRLPFQEGFIQGAGVIAGGIIATLLDEAMAHVAIANLQEQEGKHTATIDFSIKYFSAARRDQELIASAWIAKKGKRICFLESEIMATTHVIAKATASFLISS